MSKIKEYYLLAKGYILTSRWLIFAVYLFQMMRMAISLFRADAKLRIGKIDELMIVHVHPEMLTPQFMEYTQSLGKAIADPYRTLYGVDPIILVMPYGSTIHSVNMEGFFSLLNSDQKRMLKMQMQKIKSIEVVQDLQSIGIG